MEKKKNNNNNWKKKSYVLILRVAHFKKLALRDFPCGPVVKTLCFHCRGHRFDPWLGN